MSGNFEVLIHAITLIPYYRMTAAAMGWNNTDHRDSSRGL